MRDPGGTRVGGRRRALPRPGGDLALELARRPPRMAVQHADERLVVGAAAPAVDPAVAQRDRRRRRLAQLEQVAAHVEVPDADRLGAADPTKTVEDRKVSERDGAADAVRDGGGVGDAEGVAQRRDARRRVGVERAVEDVPETSGCLRLREFARRIARRIRIARRTPSSPPTRRAW